MALPVHSKLTPDRDAKRDQVIHRISLAAPGAVHRFQDDVRHCGSGRPSTVNPCRSNIPAHGRELLHGPGQRDRPSSAHGLWDHAGHDARPSCAAAGGSDCSAACTPRSPGEPARETMLWAALLRAGPDAILSHQTAAERHGLIDEPSAVITITVPSADGIRRSVKIPRHHDSPVGRDPADQASGHAPAVHPGGGHGAGPDPGRADLRRRLRVDLPGPRARRLTTADRIRQAMDARKKDAVAHRARGRAR